MRQIPIEIEELSAARAKLSRECKQINAEGMKRFFTEDDLFDARPKAEGKSDTEADGNPTAASFAYYLLRKSGAIALGDARFRTAMERAAKKLEETSSGTKSTAASEPDTERLPNAYNTPILIAGVLLAINDGLVEGPNPESLSEQLEFIAEEVFKNSGFLGPVGAGDYSEGQRPYSAFNTFWAVAALREAKVWGSASQVEKADACLELVGKWAQSAVAELIAWHFADVPSRFDPDDAILSAALTYVCSKETDAHKIADKAVSVAFENYVRDGQLTKSRPVYFDQKNKRVVTMSTYEAASYLLAFSIVEQPGPKVSWRPLAATAARASDSWLREKGIPNDQDARSGSIPEPTSFSTAAAISAMHFALRNIEVELDYLSKKELGILPPEPPTAPRTGQFAPNLQELAEKFVIGKVNSPRPMERKNAFYSMIWFGPPGTGKTSAAKALAKRLGWSFVQITLKDFLVDGASYIDAAAERVFRLLLNIQNTVVLFDELEELVQERQSASANTETRRLTTSMLPRIHDLRDQENVVFIFATNIIETMDGAATRLGRFDAVVGLPPPDYKARQSIFRDLVQRRTSTSDALSPEATEMITKLSEQIASKHLPRGMIFKDIEFIVKQIFAEATIQLDRKDNLTDEKMRKLAEKITANVVTIQDDALKQFKDALENHARPHYKLDLD